MNDPSGNLAFLWACNATPSSLSAAAAIRRWLVPVASRLAVVAVAPVGKPMVDRVLPRSPDRKERELQEARNAAAAALAALGEVSVPAEAIPLWGAPSKEILAEAERGAYDIIVLEKGARSRRGSLSSTTTGVLDVTQRSVFVAREDREGPVLVMANTERWFRKALEHLQRLHIDHHIPILIVAVLDSAKPYGGMLLSFSEHVREQEQAVQDAQHLEIQAAFLDGLEVLSAGERDVRLLRLDRERRGWAAFMDELSPSLVVVGDMPSGGHARHPDSIAAQVAADAPCSVLVAR